MAKLFELPSHTDERGTLTVFEKILGFSIKRVYYIYSVNDLPRGGHAHKTGKQALICVSGSCLVDVKTCASHQKFQLSLPHQCLLVEPREWHQVKFQKNSILLVLSSKHYNPQNYLL